MAAKRKTRGDHGRSEAWERAAVVKAFERNKNTLGLRLRNLRQEMGLTQEDAAEHIGIHAKQLQRLESSGANAS